MAWLLPNAGNKMADDKMRKTLEYILSYNFADTRRVARCLGGAARRSGGAGRGGQAALVSGTRWDKERLLQAGPSTSLAPVLLLQPEM